MYQKYQTEALVLGSREYGEADRICALYTRDFGLVWARASGVRKADSKMRFALQHCAHASVALVRGKRGWRLAGAIALNQLKGDLVSTPAFARVSHLVMRLVHGEEQNAYLFDALSEAHRALAAGADGTTVEIVCVARVLYALGYLSAEALESSLFTHTTYALPQLAEVESQREHLLREINRAIAETQL